MKKTYLLILVLLFARFVFGQTPATDPHWILDWHDEFNFFDTTIWIKGHHCDHYGEPQLYLKDNVWTANGNLVIRINNTPTQGDTTFNGQCGCFCESCTNTLHPNTSGWVESKEAFTKQYGFIEARMKIPHRRGFWPAFWTYRKNGGFQTVGEIDIFEIYGCKIKRSLLETNIHSFYDQNYNDGQDSSTLYLVRHDLKNFDYTEWHTYAIEWDRNRIIWYVDRQPIRIMRNHGIIDTVHLILNLATQQRSGCRVRQYPPLVDYMYVDYVRTYSLRCDAETVVWDIPNFSTYDYKVKKSITLSGNTSIPEAGEVSLRATQYIELRPGFEVPEEGTLFLDVCPCP